MGNFNENYSAFYNLIYKDKDYKKEAEFIYRLLKQHSNVDLGQVTGLDLACGTGKHIFELEKFGLSMEGSDISANMIAVAQQDAAALGSTAKFYNHSFQECDAIKNKYSYVISMFSAIDYLTDNNDLNRTLANIHGLLEDDGLFIFDYWNGNAVVRDYSPVKVLKKSRGNEEILRISNTELDVLNQIATVKFNCMYFVDGVKKEEFNEVHPMRYFYFKELHNFLTANNFEIVAVQGFLNESDALDPYEWNVTCITRKLKAKA